MTEEEIQRLKNRFGSGGGAAAAPVAAPEPARSPFQQFLSGARDVGKSIETGLTRGIVGTPGAPADLTRAGQMARDYMRSTNIGGPSEGTFPEVRAREDARREREAPLPLKPSTLQDFGSQRFIEAADDLSGGATLYTPETRAGRAVAMPAEIVGGGVGGGFLGAARAGARSIPGVALRQGVVPAVAVGGAQAVGVENPVALGAIGMAAGAGAEAGRTRSAQSALQNRTAGATPAQLQQAEALFQQAQRQNLPLSRANALDMVTGGQTSASGLQRVVEGQGSPALDQFYANSPDRIAAAGGRALDQVAPVSPEPSTIGPRVAGEMRGEIGDVNRNINTTTRPAYAAIEQTPLPQAEFLALMQNPLFARTHKEVFSNPELNHLTQGLAPDSVGAVDLTRRLLAQGEQRVQNPVAQNWNPTAATGYSTSADKAQAAASDASRQALATQAGQPSPLEAVQAAQAQLRQQHLDPLQAGPEGRAAAAGTTEGVQGAMFPQNPLEGSHAEVGRMVTSLSRRDPELAAEVVRNYLGTQFAAVQRGGQAGATYYGAPAFWKQVMGNPEQRASLTSALNALPQGGARAEVFHDVMRVFNAMGQRERAGSKTAYNVEDLARMKESGLSEGAIKVIAGAGLKWPEIVKDRIESWRLGQNTEELADLFTNPARGADFARIARTTAPGSPGRIMQVMRLLGGPGPLIGTVAAPVGATVREEERRR